MFITETIQPWGSLRFLHHTSEVKRGFVECRIYVRKATLTVKARVKVMGRIRIRITVGVVDGIYVVLWCKKIVLSKSIGTGDTFCQSIGVGIGNTFHKYC